jgi:hypothetical protein
MEKLKLPLIRNEETFWPSELVCPICKSKKVFEPHSMAVLSLGALLMDRTNDSGRPSSDLDAFFRLSWHGAHEGGEGEDREIGCTLDIVRDIHGGEAELYFCSTACLRQFFNQCVDELERKVASHR